MQRLHSVSWIDKNIVSCLHEQRTYCQGFLQRNASHQNYHHDTVLLEDVHLVHYIKDIDYALDLATTLQALLERLNKAKRHLDKIILVCEDKHTLENANVEVGEAGPLTQACVQCHAQSLP